MLLLGPLLALAQKSNHFNGAHRSQKQCNHLNLQPTDAGMGNCNLGSYGQRWNEQVPLLVIAAPFTYPDRPLEVGS